MEPTLTQEAKNALIEALTNQAKTIEGIYSDSVAVDLEAAISIIESFPVSDGWIPVSERLPNSSEYVLITNGKYVSFADFFDSKWYYPSNETPPFVYTDVTHWQPLPSAPHKRSE